MKLVNLENCSRPASSGPTDVSCGAARRGDALLSPRRTTMMSALFAMIAAAPARASLFSGEALDTVADVMAIVVLIVVPIVVIVVFWLVHVLPERIAEKNHHPQTAAIQTLCLLSLAFGGLLWPLAWLWAYTKPVLHRMAYGTDRGVEWHEEMGERARAGQLVQADIEHLRTELDAMAARGALPPKLEQIRADLAALKPEPTPESPVARRA